MTEQPSLNGVCERPINRRIKTSDHKKAKQQKKTRGLEEGQKDKQPDKTGGLPAGTQTGPADRPQEPKLGEQWSVKLDRLKKALKEWTGKGLVYVGRDRAYKGHTRLIFNGKCPLHPDNSPSLMVYFDLVSGYLVPICPACGSKEDSDTWVGRFCFALNLGGDALKPPKGWIPVKIPDEGAGSLLSPEELEERYGLLDQVYGHISRTTGLLPAHKQHLLGRGLKEEHITQDGYFSLELVDHIQYGTKPGDEYWVGAYVGQKFAGVPGVPEAVLATIPGFFWRSAKRTCEKMEGDLPLPKHLVFRPCEGKGIAIPYRDTKGRITGLQARSFEPGKVVEEKQPDGTITTKVEKPRKYMFLPRKKTGKWADMPGTSVHVPLGFSPPPPGGRLRITEGGLKANTATALGRPCIGVPSIGMWPLALPLIELWKPGEVEIMYDMVPEGQYEASPEKLHGDKFAFELRQRGIRPMRTTWAFADGKGIDDLLFGKGSPDVTEWVDLQSQLRQMMPNSPLELWKAIRGQAKMIWGTVAEGLFFSSDDSRVWFALFEDSDGPITRTIADLERKTGIGRHRVKRAIDRLIGGGLIHSRENTYWLPELAGPRPIPA